MTIFQDQKTLYALLPFSIYITLYFNNKSKKDVGTFLNKYEAAIYRNYYTSF